METSPETELKLALEQRDYLRICAGWDPPVHVLEQDNLFFISDSLKKAQVSLRLRQENDKYFLTCKGPSHQLELAVQRMEIETELPAEFASQLQLEPQRLLKLDNPVSDLLRKRAVQKDLRPWLRFRNLRKRYQIELDKGMYLAELDHSYFDHDVEDYELELEFSRPDADAVKGLQDALKASLQQLNVAMRVQIKGKLARAIAAQRGT